MRYRTIFGDRQQVVLIVSQLHITILHHMEQFNLLGAKSRMPGD